MPAVLFGAVLLLFLYLYRVNRGMGTPPAKALALSPRRWTDEEIRETYERVCKEPLDSRQLLPPKLERRYIVVGGSGEHCLLLLSGGGGGSGGGAFGSTTLTILTMCGQVLSAAT